MSESPIGYTPTPERIPRPFTTTFRDKPLRYIFRNILTGDAISIVGMGTVGKSHLITHFSDRKDVQYHYIPLMGGEVKGVSPEDVLFVRIDPNALLDTHTLEGTQPIAPSWAGFELVFSRLLLAAQRNRLHNDVIELLQNHYVTLNDLTHMRSVAALRHLERGIRAVLEGPHAKKRLVFVFDQFEEILRYMPLNFFTNLRSLRDEFRYHLIYIVASRIELAKSVDPEVSESYESFIELFQHPLYLGPCRAEEDQTEVFAYLQSRRRAGRPALHRRIQQRMLWATGGHSGILRTCFNRISYFGDIANDDELLDQLLNDANIRRECAIILRSCTGAEQETLLHVADEMKKHHRVAYAKFPDRGDTLQTLYNKYIFDVEDGAYIRIEPPLLYAYLKRYEEFTQPIGTTPQTKRDDSRPDELPL